MAGRAPRCEPRPQVGNSWKRSTPATSILTLRPPLLATLVVALVTLATLLAAALRSSLVALILPLDTPL